MEKFKFNIVNLGDKMSIGIKPNFPLEAGRWFNFTCEKRHIKDKSLDDDVLLNF